MEAYPKPRHQYVYTPRYGQRGYLSYAGQQANGAYPTGVIPNAGIGAGIGYGGYGYNAPAASYHPGVYATTPYNTSYSYPYASSHLPSYPSPYGAYYNYGLYGSMYPLANFYYPYQRTYYNTNPTYGYATQAYVYPPGPSATTTTTYHVTNSHASGPGSPSAAAYAHQARSPQYTHGSTREDIQMENRRVATERGAYSARRIKPADARDDDPFWCRERNGEWHLRTFYQIENECHPGTWQMDAEVGFLIFHRE